MNQYFILSIEMNFLNTTDVIHPVVLKDERHCVLIDCGYVGSLSKIENALLLNNIMPSDITHIIITHQDHDHMGAAAAFKRKYPNTQILAFHIEAPYISGEEKSLRLIQAEKLQEILPEEQKAFGTAFCNVLRSVEPINVEQKLMPDEKLPFCGECRVIHTPGHTPGHISLYVPSLDIIITGDAIASEDGKPVISNPQFTLDLDSAYDSMKKLLSTDCKTVICYHGDAIVRGV